MPLPDNEIPGAELFGAIDGFRLPAFISGWAIKLQDEAYVTDLQVEVWQNGAVVARAELAGPRVDVTQDETVDAAFALDCSGFASAGQLIDGTIVVMAVDPDGRRKRLDIFAPVRERMKQEAALDTLRAMDAPAAAAALGVLANNQALSGAAAAAVARGHGILIGTIRTGEPTATARRRNTRITFIGAGSTVFAKNLLGDILSDPALSGSTICLYDIDAERLRISAIVAGRIVDSLGSPARIETTTNLGQALDGADYAISMIQVAGYRPGTVTDFEIPNRFGLRQTIGDTLGIGGIMRALRTIPVMRGIAAEMERRCPDVLHLNYVNPMAMNCWALSRSSSIKTVGLCHSVQGTAAELAHDINVPLESIDYTAAGINHMAFYLNFTAGGEDLYPLIRRVAAEGRVPPKNRVRYDVLNRLGYFVTESSEHFAEYVPWYIKRGRGELIERFAIPLDEYPRRCELQIENWNIEAEAFQDTSRKLTITPSNEYGARIISSIETGEPTVIYGNVPNTGLIGNLPEGCCVEVPCLVDGNGVQPVQVGKLPPQLAALIQTNINVQALTVEAALTGRRDHIYHAAMLDPHTAAELDLDQIHALVDELLHAHRDWLPDGYYS